MKFEQSRLSLYPLLLLVSVNAVAQSDSGVDSNLAQSCSQLSSLNLVDTTISLTEVVGENSFTIADSDDSLEHPAFCRVVGVISPAVNAAPAGSDPAVWGSPRAIRDTTRANTSLYIRGAEPLAKAGL